MFPEKRAAVTALFILFAGSSYAQFPDFPPDTVDHVMDRDQMVWLLGISFPQLPAKQDDPNRPSGVFPSDQANPEGNWTDSAQHTITSSGFGLWNN
jgi:hypothetical protein